MRINLVRDLAHMGVFFVLTAVIWLGLKYGQGVAPRLGKLVAYRTWIAVSFSLLYAAADEIHQYYVPKRSGNVKDGLIDSTGILLAVTMLVLWERQHSLRGATQTIASFLLQAVKLARFKQTTAWISLPGRDRTAVPLIRFPFIMTGVLLRESRIFKRVISGRANHDVFVNQFLRLA